MCYSAIHWDENVLYLADELGFVGVLNVYMDKPFVWKKLSERKINKIQVVRHTSISYLIIQTDI